MLALFRDNAPRARSWRKLAPSGARAALVALVALSIVTSLPMSSPPAEAARTVSTFSDGSDVATIEWTTMPSPGERQVVYFKIRPDVEVVSAHVNMTSTMFERYFEAFGSGTSLLPYAIDLSGDLNGDGFNDMMLTTPGSGGGAGIVFGLFGRAGGFIIPPINVEIDGTTANDFMGWSISTGGDLNGDKRDDLVVGTIQMDFTASSGTGAGKVNIHWGGNAVNATVDTSRSYGETGDCFGWSVSTRGDINNDGRADMVVGAPRNIENQDNPGLAYVYLSGTGGPGSTPDVTLTGDDDGDAFGYVADICGDVDGDGYDDILVTAPSHNGTSDYDIGKSYLYLGDATGGSTSPSWTYTGGAQGDLFGYSAQGIGDVNGDGYDDIAVGAPLADTSTLTDAGRVFVFYGHASGPSASPDVTIDGAQANGLFGFALANLGDADGDGLNDMSIGAPDVDNGTLTSAGAVYVVFGDTNGMSSTPDLAKYGTTADMDLGNSLAPGGDGDGDGFCDMLVGDYTLQATFLWYGSGGIKNPKVFFDNTEIIKVDGSLRGPRQSVDFTAMVNAYIAAHRNEVDENGDLLVPLNVTFASRGRLLLTDLNVMFFRLTPPVGLKAAPLARGNAVQLSWDAQMGDDTTAFALEMWNGTGWQELRKIPRLNVSHTLEGLVDGQEYEFRLRGYDGGVQRFSEPSNTVKVTPRDTLPPVKVINVTAKGVAALRGINVTWNPTDPDTVHYEVWSDKSGTWTVIANVSAPDTFYLDTDIDDGPKYNYRVRAWDEVPQAGELSAIISGDLKDTTKPAMPTGLHLEPLPAGNALRITWDLNTDDTVSYSLQSNKTGDWREIAGPGKTVTEHVDTGLVDGVRYYYRIGALDESNNPSDFSLIVSGIPRDTVPPAAPVGVTVAPRAIGNTLRVEWTPNIDDTVAYRIYILLGTTWTQLAEVPANSLYYDAIGLVDGQAYQVRVASVDDAGLESEPSAPASGTPRDTQFPSIPTGLKLTLAPEGSAVNVSWSANYDDAVEYKVYRFEEGTWRLIATLTGGTLFFMDTGLMNGMPYAYVVTAIDEVGNESPYSERKEAVPLDTVAPSKPYFIEMPTKVRSKDLVVRGRCEPLAKITLHVNKLTVPEVQCDAAGLFNTTVRLRSGSNEIYATAADGSGLTTESERMTLFVDEMAPSILSTSPANGDVQVEPEGLVIEYIFTEDIMSGKLVVVIIEGKLTNYGTILLELSKPGVITTSMLSYIRQDLRATFNISTQLKNGKSYTVVLKGLEDIAGNPQATEGDLGLWAFSFTISGTPVGPDGDGDDGGGISSGVLMGVAALIIIIIVVVVFVFVIKSGARGETVEVERGVVGAQKAELTAEESRPDVQDLYKQAYDERGGEAVEKHEVDAGLGNWLAAQEQASKAADEETKRLVAEMAKQPAPPAETGPIEMIPPALAAELAAKAEAEKAAEAAEAEAQRAAEAAEDESKTKDG